MKQFKVSIFNEAANDFNKALDFYKTINVVVAKKFNKSTKEALNDLKKNPFYQIRYDDFRLKTVKGYPYVFHFTVDDKLQRVFVYGLKNTFQNPETSYIKK